MNKLYVDRDRLYSTHQHHTEEAVYLASEVDARIAELEKCGNGANCCAQAARIEELEKALNRSMVAIDDWLNTYASEFCHQARVQEAMDRICEYGTIGYIANVQDQNRKALGL